MDLGPACLALLAWTGVASVAGFSATAWDKSRARQGRRRVRERTLHGLALAGGWPGGLLAMLLLRHKTRKPSFLGVFALCSAASLAGAWLLARTWCPA